MPSSITLTVRELPVSTSFFLSALQPLDYTFRGRTGSTIGFGPASNPSQPADFWITQEITGCPAGAAHVAFPASSPDRVQKFYNAATKAGGRGHGMPENRDSSGYFSAAVIDLDGNSIEAVYRPYADDKASSVAKSVVARSVASRSVASPSIVSRSTASPSVVSRSVAPRSIASSVKTPSVIAPSQAGTVKSVHGQELQTAKSGDVLNNIFAEVKSAADVARKAMQNVRPSPATFQSEPILGTQKSTDDAVVGTLLGVAAGAALTYVFTRRSKDDTSDPPSRPPMQAIDYPDDQSFGYRRDSYPMERSVTMEELQYPPSGFSRGRRNSTSTVPSMLEEEKVSRVSYRSGSRSRFEPIRMIEGTPSTTSRRSSSKSRAPSQVSTVKPSKQPTVASIAASMKSSRASKAYPPSAFKGGLPTPPSSVTTARKYPLPPSRTNSEYTSASKPSRSHSRASTVRQAAEYPLPQSDAGSTYVTANGDGKSRRGSIMDEEVRPEDSISQVSVNSKKSSRSRK